MRRVLVFLAVLLTCLWGVGLMYVNGLACAYGNARVCRFPWPWRMSGEDIVVGYVIPGGIILGLLVLSRVVGPRRGKGRQNSDN